VSTQHARVLAALADGRWHSTVEFHDAGIPRSPSRIHELRKAGHKIESRAGAGGFGEYRLDAGQLTFETQPAATPPASCPECELGRGLHVDGCSLAPGGVQ
jgi:hypothetical protein